MPGFQDLIKLSLVSKRQDIIRFTEAICSDEIKLSIASDFSNCSFSKSLLLVIDASLFIDFDFRMLESGEKLSRFSICIIPPGMPPQLVRYVEKSFRYIISFPVSTDYFRSYCLRVKSGISNLSRGSISRELESPPIPDSFSGYFCGESSLIKKVRSQILMAAASNEPVLILGETGTGKTTAAQVIHTLSDRNSKKMVSVSLSTIVETLAESAFFGHTRGSFTNAESECCGYFELADGSTLFLDELGVAPISVQAMLLTVLDNGNYKKIGDNKEYHADVRMIFATNADIEKMMSNGHFRQDLYFRICDNIIRIPPLREHKADIRGMVMHYLDEDIRITEDALACLEDYSWPGNIRELHKCLRRAAGICRNKVITVESIDFGDINFPQ